MNHSLKERRVAQKEAQLMREISTLFRQIALDEADLQSLSITRVKLSSNKSHCTVFFQDPEGEKKFRELIQTLILYKPSIRKAISQQIPSRYTPEIIFKYDTLYDKQRRIDDLILNIMSDPDQSKE